ncbi:protein lifeguard 1 isoform X2 [Leptinotarsa decemlineata]|nr:protein lifeguard 1-like isoform X2 [Leptinotarsa decemlineata]XP_023029197.1 protein lifeguard 1-like isoform X2 [Leptinotarsa decemlineata]
MPPSPVCLPENSKKEAVIPPSIEPPPQIVYVSDGIYVPQVVSGSAESGIHQQYDVGALEDPLVKGFSFDNPSIRRGFIRKVYAILSVQLAITLSFICWFLFDCNTKEFVQNNPILLFISIGVVFVSLIFLACCGDLRRRAPMNYIILFTFTLAESVLLGTITSMCDVDIVALAVGMTAIVCFGLTLFAFQTKFDFTFMGGMLFIFLLLLIVMGIAFAVINTNILNLVYSFLGALLFSAYLVYDTQLMLGGSHKYAISPEEYIFAAINLYVDIINLFLRILIILRHFR